MTVATLHVDGREIHITATPEGVARVANMLAVIPFNRFVTEAGVTGDRLDFHEYVVNRLGSTNGITRGYWRRLLDEFDREQDIRDLQQTQADALI